MGSLDTHATVHWVALAAVFLGYPVFLGTIVGRIPWIAPLFRGDHSYWWRFWGVVIAVAWMVAFVVYVCLASSGAGLSSIGAVVPHPAALIAAALVVAAFAALTLSAKPSPEVSRPADPGSALWPHSRSERLFWLLAASPTAAIAEEMAYRGFALTFLASLMGALPASILQAVIFGFHHGGFSQTPAFFGVRSLFGLVLAWLTIWSGSLAAAVGIHFFIDALLAIAPPRQATAAL